MAATAERVERGPNLVDKRCGRTDWFTPPRVLDAVRAYALETIGRAAIPLDPAGDVTNYTRAEQCFAGAEVPVRPGLWGFNGLGVSWEAPLVFVNPPYGRELPDWCAKIGREASRRAHIVALLPGNRFETGYVQEEIFSDALDAICLVRRRLQFCDSSGEPVAVVDQRTGKPRKCGNPYGSLLYLFNGNPYAFARAFGGLGKVCAITQLGG